MDEINRKHHILPPEVLRYDRDGFWWPLKWGDAPLVEDDPCDSLPRITIIYLMQQLRRERTEKKRRLSGGYTPVKWSR